MRQFISLSISVDALQVEDTGPNLKISQDGTRTSGSWAKPSVQKKTEIRWFLRALNDMQTCPLPDVLKDLLRLRSPAMRENRTVSPIARDARRMPGTKQLLRILVTLTPPRRHATRNVPRCCVTDSAPYHYEENCCVDLGRWCLPAPEPDGDSCPLAIEPHS